MSASRKRGARGAVPYAQLSVATVRTGGGSEHGGEITVWSPAVPKAGVGSSASSLAFASPPLLVDAHVVPADARCSFTKAAEFVCARVALGAGVSCYGLGEGAGPLLRNGRTTRMWNTDAWCYGEEDEALYQSHPYVLAVRPDGRAVGLLADTFRRGEIELDEKGVEFRFEGEPFALYRIEGPDPTAVQRGLAALVGHIDMPPRWALGYHQCRWSYESADEIRALAREFAARDIPCAALWFDIDYMDRHRVFTWHAARFPDPRGLIDELHAQGIRAVAILDPGIAIDEEYDVYAEGTVGNYFVLSRNGRPARGRVWPGWCRFPDFTAARTRAWWARRAARFVAEADLDGLWNDMNEPAVFRVPGKTLPDSARHVGVEGAGPGNHARYHNLYGQLMTEASRAGLSAARPDRRPFVLTRANHLAGSRFAAAWTGDNRSRWEDLRWSIPMVLNLGISGQPFAGPDVGGFFGDPSPELFARWFAFGAFLPFFRGHSEKSSCRKEPWAFGAETEAHVRTAIERRMRLLPTLYTLFREATETGMPVVRPLFFADSADTTLRAIDDAFLVGNDLLVAPIVHEGESERTVRLPVNPGGWFAFPGGGARITAREVIAVAALGELPRYARAGSILFESTACDAIAGGGELVVHAFLDDEGTARGRLYEDEGDGHAHLERVFLDRRLEVRDGKRGIEVRVETDGTWRPPTRRRRMVVHGCRGRGGLLDHPLDGTFP